MAGMGLEQLQSSERTERTPGPSERLTFFTLLYLEADIYISEINLIKEITQNLFCHLGDLRAPSFPLVGNRSPRC